MAGIVDLETPSSTCINPPNYPQGVTGSKGLFYNDAEPLVCGGVQNGNHGSSNCYTFYSGLWQPFPSMLLVRRNFGFAPTPFLENPNGLLATGEPFILKCVSRALGIPPTILKNL